MRIHRTLAAIAAPLAVLAALAGCSSRAPVPITGTAGPAGGSGVAASSPAPAAGSTGATSTTGAGLGQAGTTSAGSSGSNGNSNGNSNGKGCGKGASLPAGARPVTTADLDGDGRPDQLWLADQGGRRLIGISTAAGGVTYATFTSAAPQSASATAARLADGTVVILVNPGRIVQLFAFVDCIIVPSLNAQGHQYAFDTGFTGYGTGAGCPVIGPGRELVGYQVTGENGGDAPYTVTRTTVDLSNYGRRAVNGTTSTLGRHLPATSSIVTTARTVACGPDAPALEPQS